MSKINLQKPKFYETKPLVEMTEEEWESLCDGCGKCCFRNSLQDEENTKNSILQGLHAIFLTYAQENASITAIVLR